MHPGSPEPKMTSSHCLFCTCSAKLNLKFKNSMKKEILTFHKLMFGISASQITFKIDAH